MKYLIKVINAFTNRDSHGNPAGFLYTKTELTSSLMENIAKQMGLSETAFVHPSQLDSSIYRVHFYTPNKRIESCGHATVASFGYIKQSHQLKTNQVSIVNDLGPTKVIFENNRAYLAHIALVKQDLETTDIFELRSLSVQLKTKPLIIGCGVRFVSFEVSSKEDLANLKIDRDLMIELSEKYNLIGFYIFAQLDKKIYTRMFAPHFGIEEESGTGMAAAPLYYWLKEQGRVENQELTIYQGYFTNPIRESQIHCFEKEGRLLVGGEIKVVGEKEINL